MAPRPLLLVLVPLTLLSACSDDMSTASDDLDPLDDVPMVSVHVEVTGDGAGSVEGPGIACGGDCDEVYAAGTQIELVATPAPGSYFAGWTGDGCADVESVSAQTCAATIDGGMNLVATFALASYTLDVGLVGDGRGTVTSDLAGIACGASCQATFTYGTRVTLTATAEPGSEVVGWSVPSCPGTGPCTVTVTESLAVTAELAVQRHALTVIVDGDGAGSVTSAPSGIDCGASGTACTATFPHGAEVSLTPTAGASSVFSGWSGACTGTGACTVDLSGPTTVTATFAPVPMVTSFQAAGTWACTGIGTNCQDVYDVDLTAGAAVTVNVGSVTGSSVVRLAAYQGAGTTNLLTGSDGDLQCSDQNTPTTATFVAPASGRYRIGVGRDWGASGGSTGAYALTLSSSTTFGAYGRTVNDGTTSTASSCPDL